MIEMPTVVYVPVMSMEALSKQHTITAIVTLKPHDPSKWITLEIKK